MGKSWQKVFTGKNGFWNGINQEFSEWQQNYFKNTEKFFLILFAYANFVFIYLFFYGQVIEKYK